MKIWAHRECSRRYPKNTLTVFEEAISVDGISRIELGIRIQMMVKL